MQGYVGGGDISFTLWAISFSYYFNIDVQSCCEGGTSIPQSLQLWILMQDPGCWNLHPASCMLDPRSWIQDPGSTTQDPGFRIQDPGSLGYWMLDGESRILDWGCYIPHQRTEQANGRSLIGGHTRSWKLPTQADKLPTIIQMRCHPSLE